MSDTLVSQVTTFDQKTGQYLDAFTYESFESFYTTPSGAFDIQKTLSDGKYLTSYKTYQSSSGAYNYQIQSSLSTEPLLTHPIFAADGTKELTADDKKKIQQAQQNPELYAQYVADSATSNLGWYSQFVLWGVESYLAPAVTLHITTDDDNLPDLSTIGKTATINNGPSLGGSANWLFAGCTAEALVDSKWRVTREYRASGPAGWSSTLYGTGS